MDYNIIILFIALILTILILMSILLGCKFNYYNTNSSKIEKFTTEKKEENNEIMVSEFEKNFLADLSRGILTEDDIKNLILNNKLKEDNIMNLIKYASIKQNQLSVSSS